MTISWRGWNDTMLSGLSANNVVGWFGQETGQSADLFLDSHLRSDQEGIDLILDQPCALVSLSTLMRPTLQVLTPQQIDHILADAKRILAEVGIEVRGLALRQRLLAARPAAGRHGAAGALPAGRGGSSPPQRAALDHALRPRRPAARHPGRRPGAFRARLQRPVRLRLSRRRAPAGHDRRLRGLRAAGRWPGAHRLPGDSLLHSRCAASHRRRLAAVPGAYGGAAAGGVGRVHRARRACA